MYDQCANTIKHNYMNKFMLFLFLMLSAAGCKKENTPDLALDEKIDPLFMPMQKTIGSFANGPYGTVVGTAKIYEVGTGTKLSLEGFSSTNGPNLMVYLSKEKEPLNFINLGDLKATGGNQVYDIPSGVKVGDYKYALIYCKQFSHLFGFCEFK